jgi:hypothetical protein
VRVPTLVAAIGAALSSSFAGRPSPPPREPTRGEPAVLPVVLREDPPSGPRSAPWAAPLGPLRFVETRTRAQAVVTLYAADGALDEDAALAVDRVALAESLEPPTFAGAPTVLALPRSRRAAAIAPPPRLDRRLLRLLVKAAAHFHASEVDLVSTFRDAARPGSRHRLGEAADFSFPGVTAAALAAHLRGYARVGVGVYTNRRTQFVHLDVRAESYHWADASPPGVSWRESRMTDRAAPARDEAWAPEQDLPESAAPGVATVPAAR